MKKLYFVLFLIVAVFTFALADKSDKILRIYHSGTITNIPLSEIEEITHSNVDIENVMYSDYVTTITRTIDSTYRIPINSIDSVIIVKNDIEKTMLYIEEIQRHLISMGEQPEEQYRENLITWLNNECGSVYKATTAESKNDINVCLKNGVEFYISFVDYNNIIDLESEETANSRITREQSKEPTFFDVSHISGEVIFENSNLLYISGRPMPSIELENECSNAIAEWESLNNAYNASLLKGKITQSARSLSFLKEKYSDYGIVIISQTHGYDQTGDFQVDDQSVIQSLNNGEYSALQWGKPTFNVYTFNGICSFNDEIIFKVSAKKMRPIFSKNVVYANYCHSAYLGTDSPYLGTEPVGVDAYIYGYVTPMLYSSIIDNKMKWPGTDSMMVRINRLFNGKTFEDAMYTNYYFTKNKDESMHLPYLNKRNKKRLFSISTNDLKYDNGDVIVSGKINGYKENLKPGIIGIVYEHAGNKQFTPETEGTKKYLATIKEDGSYEARIPNNGREFNSDYGYVFGFDKYYGETKTIPRYTVITKPVVNDEIGENTAVLRGKLTGDLTRNGTICFYCTKVEGTPVDPAKTEKGQVIVCSLSKLQDNLEEGCFSYELKDLEPNTQYVFNTFALIEGYRFYGEPMTFQTKKELKVETGDYDYNSSIPTKVTLFGSIPNFSPLDMDDEGLEVGFVYAPHSSLNIDNAQFITIYPIGEASFSGVAENLQMNTTYFYAAYIKKGDRIQYGEEKSFKTSTPKEFTVSTKDCQNIKSTSATLMGQVDDFEKEEMNGIQGEVGFIISTSNNPSLDNSNGTRIKVANLQDLVSGSFSKTVLQLQSNTVYYYRAYLSADNYVNYGEVKILTTGIEVSIETLAATDVTSSSAQLNGCLEGFEELKGKYPIGFYYSNSADFTSSSAQYIAMSRNNDNVFSAIIDNLTPETDYYFSAVVDVNGEKHLGNILHFQTPRTNMVQTEGCEDVESQAATLLGRITDFNSEDYTDVIGEVGFVIGTSNILSVNTLNNTKIKVGDLQSLTKGDFAATINELKENTTYYYTAYMIADYVISYGEVKNFTTPRLLNIKTLGAGDVTSSSAKVLGQAVNLNTVTEQYQIGFYYSTDSEPGPSNGVYAASVYTDTDGSFYAELSDLESETQYFYVAVIQVGNELIFGDEIRSFMTEEAKPEVAEPVDLGLSVKWARWNLGAGTPEEIGGLYAIGELQPKEEFTWENYQVSTDISGCFSATKYDAAFNTWGKDWRLPTKEELSELRNNCNLTYTEQNGVKGLLVTGPNGNSIFLPDPYVSYRGTYLSGNCQDKSVFTLYFREYYTETSYYSNRNFGFPIRPVYSPGIKDMSIETFDATNIKVYSATITGKIEDPHWANLTEVGFYYNTTGNPHEGNGEYISLGGRSSTSEFKFNFKDLTPSTTYYYVAAARLFDDIFYGDEKTFTTVKYNEVPTSGQKIDLGLSVKWAGWNIGATSPSGCGNYYPWGVTQERSYLDYYSYEHRPTSDDPGADYKDIGSNISGTKYDVARVKWGGTWRIPTKEEINELIEKCTIEARTYDGMPGSLFTGPNGNSIFLPEAGEKWQSTVREKNKSGWYWSANEEKGYRNMSAGILWVADDYAKYTDMNKVTGLTIRPVCDD